jgi:hypothetical protein
MTISPPSRGRWGASKLLSQRTIDEIYSKMVLFILPPNKNKDKNPRPKNGVRTERTARRRKTHYLNGRTQKLYKKNPGVLVKYIREGIPWLDNPETNINPAHIRALYTALCGTSPEIDIPFIQSQPPTNEIPTEEVFRAITKKGYMCVSIR